VSDVAAAASVLLARGPASREVFLVRRATHLRFMGGFHAFPGGKVHAADAQLSQNVAGLSAKHVAAVRELFEETGVLLARGPDSAFPPAAELTPLRHDLLAEQVAFGDVLARLSLRIRPEDLQPAGSLVTPAFSPTRFDAAFFVATLPAGQTAEVWPGELAAGLWMSSEAILEAWTRGELLVSPPTVSLLEVIRGRPVHEVSERIRPLLDSLAGGDIPLIWFAPATLMIPLHCLGLPPSTHTNAFLVGTGPVYLLDPGPVDPGEQQKLFQILDARAAAGQRLSTIVLTHHHPDHVGAVTACARRYQVPILAHRLTRQALRGKIEVQQELEEGALLDLGPAPHGKGRWHLTALHTPGHAPGHLAFYEPHYRLLFAGDMVSTLTSVVIAPGEGDLAVYLDSLRRLQILPARLLLPAHGPPSARPDSVLDEALAHRAKREQELLAALGPEPRTADDLAVQLYRGLPAPMMRFAEWQVLSGLQKLQREGRAHSTPNGWQLLS
jgi:glyoxylase-like metal-dependent hydrolase (beta-lactamase superfamily II)/8-oxo-dGTP pyrophosphatase MutT (NUDIX family)